MKREKSNEPYFNTVLSSEENDNENFDKNFSSLTLQEKPKLKKPPLYKVIMLNDDYLGGDLQFGMKDKDEKWISVPKKKGTITIFPSILSHRIFL